METRQLNEKELEALRGFGLYPRTLFKNNYWTGSTIGMISALVPQVVAVRFVPGYGAWWVILSLCGTALLMAIMAYVRERE